MKCSTNIHERLTCCATSVDWGGCVSCQCNACGNLRCSGFIQQNHLFCCVHITIRYCLRLFKYYGCFIPSPFQMLTQGRASLFRESQYGRGQDVMPAHCRAHLKAERESKREREREQASSLPNYMFLDCGGKTE